MDTPTPTAAPVAAPAEINRNDQIVAAVKLLDNADDAHWTQAGEPDLNTLKELLGFKVSRAEVVAAVPDVKRVVAAPAAAPVAAPADTAPQPEGDDLPEAPQPVAAPTAAPAAAPAPTPAPAPKAAKGDLVKFKNLTKFKYKIGEYQIEAGATIELNMALLDKKTRAKLEHGVTVGSFAKV